MVGYSEILRNDPKRWIFLAVGIGFLSMDKCPAVGTFFGDLTMLKTHQFIKAETDSTPAFYPRWEYSSTEMAMKT